MSDPILVSMQKELREVDGDIANNEKSVAALESSLKEARGERRELLERKDRLERGIKAMAGEKVKRTRKPAKGQPEEVDVDMTEVAAN